MNAVTAITPIPVSARPEVRRMSRWIGPVTVASATETTTVHPPVGTMATE
jgi:hypothetical protein